MGYGRTAVTVVLGGAAAAVLLAILVPTAVDRARDRLEHTEHFANGAAAKAGRPEVPRWLPDKATGVAFLMSGHSSDRLIRATLPDGSLPSGCTSGRTQGSVHLSAHWFPADTPRKATAHCGLYDVALIGDQLYGWQDDATVVAAQSPQSATPVQSGPARAH